MTALETALSLHRRGLSVIPVPRPRPGVAPGHPGDGKVPAIAWKEFQERRASEDEIREWFSTEQNIAVITGSISGVVVVDLDSPAAHQWWVRRFPRTPWQTRTRKGFHVWYRHPGVRVSNCSRIETRGGRLAIDVRGDGGFVIGPGSLHRSGVRYSFAGDWTAPLERVPRFWPGWIQRPTRPAPRYRGRRPTGDVIERARAYLRATPRPEIGSGSDTATFTAACRLVRGFGIDEADAVELLWEWAGNRDGWTREWVEAKAAHALRYGSEPIGGMK